ncbi:MAG: SLBB domain-containing protein [Phycisphaerae bacterium]|nr:SLBB domain-containing protein [Phycisphaerae bacterium]
MSDLGIRNSHVLADRVRRPALAKALAAGLAGTAAAALLCGCEADSFFDQTVNGRWEWTPTVVPVIENLTAIEDEKVEYAEVTRPTPADLVPEVEAYRVGAGDEFEISIQDYFNEGKEDVFPRVIDPRGFLDIPRLPPIFVDRKTQEEMRAAIVEAIQGQQIMNDPVVSIVPRRQRKLLFNAIGGVQNAGQYVITQPNFRLFDALASAGGFTEAAASIYVIRTVPLNESVKGLAPTPGGGGSTAPSPAPAPGTPTKSGENVIDLIDELSKPKGGGSSPAVMRGHDDPPAGEPMIDLDASTSGPKPAAKPAGGGVTTWVYVDGQWTQQARRDGGVMNGGGNGGNGGIALPGEAGTASELVTQRVIEIPTARLIAGAAEYNIVIRPGDVVRVPSAARGYIYVAGQVSRPGVFTMPDFGKLTLQRAIDAAGGLSATGVPERVDLTRMVGPNRQGTIRLDLKAIAEGTQPDIFLKADDRVNVGSNFWALPMAVLRQGLRASYGFGFILDRNFGNDVFGAPPSNVLGQ